MTVPSGSSGSGYSLAGIDGVLFGNTTGAISGMQNLSQAVVQAAKMAEIEANTVLTTILNTVFDGLRNGVSLALAIIESIAVKLFGLIPGFTTVTQALNAILEVPVLSDLVHAITGIVGGSYSDLTTWAGNLALLIQQIIDAIINALNPLLGGFGNNIASLGSQIQQSLAGLLPAFRDNLDGTITALTGFADNGDGTFSYTPGANPIYTLIDNADGTFSTAAQVVENAASTSAAVGQSLSNAVNAGHQIIQQGSQALGLTAVTNDIESFAAALQTVPDNLQILNDAVYQGIANILGWTIPGFASPAQVQSAAAASAALANSASDIAHSISSTISARAISNPASWGIDQTASASFDIASMNGSTGPTINVTQSSQAACYIDTPDGGVKKAVAWLGDGTLTGITAMYINLYSVDTATKVATWVWSSDNIIGAVSGGAIPLWNYANIPAAAYLTTAQGNKYVAEIQVVGSGTYKIIGISGHWLNPNTAVTVGALGGTRTPANLYSVIGTGSTTATSSPTGTITTVTNDNLIVVSVSAYSTTSAITALAVTCGGVAMTQQSMTANYQSGGMFGYAAVFTLNNALFAAFSTGAKAIAVTTTGGGTSGTQCVVGFQVASYKNISAIGTPQTTSGTGTTSVTQTVTGLTANSKTVVHQMFSVDAATMSAYTQSQESLYSGTTVESHATGTAQAYATSVVFGATIGGAGTGAYAGIALPLTSSLAAPLQTTSPITFTDSNNIPWMALAGSEGVSQLPAKTKQFASPGTHTYTIPAQFISALAAGGRVFFDIAICPGGGGGQWVGNLPDGSVYYGLGGDAGAWVTRTLRYGTGFDIPSTTTTFTVVTGDGGGAGVPGAEGGTNGGNSSVTITGYGTPTATGGIASGGDAPADYMLGMSPGDVTLNGTLYQGGAQVWVANNGNAPGCGGGAGASSLFTIYNPGAGAPGTVIITAYMA